jgi:hypothetical protein
MLDERKLEELERLTSNLSTVIDSLRQGTEADSAVVLQRIRQNEDIRDVVNTVAAATALVAAAAPATHRGHQNPGYARSQTFSIPVQHHLTSPLRTSLQ